MTPSTRHARRRPRARRTRRGVALVELLVSLALLGVVLAAVVTLAVAGLRTAAALAARRAARATVHDAADLLAHDIRPLATLDATPADLRVSGDSAMELLATVGAAVVCAVRGPWTIDIPAPDPDGASLAWWTALPRPADVALLAVDPPDGAAPDDSTDRWLAYAIADVSSRAAACAGTPFAAPSPESPGVRLTLAAGPPLPPAVAAGTLVRLARRRRWSHYRAADGAWFLGLREWDGASWTGTQPAAGPLGAAAGIGLSIVPLDLAGAPLAPTDPPERIAALRLTVRSPARTAWTAARAPAPPDSATVVVTTRGSRVPRGAP